MAKSSLDRIQELRSLRERPLYELRQRAQEQGDEDYARLQNAYDRYYVSRQSNYDSHEQRRQEDEKERRERERLEQQQAFLAKRDETLHMYDQQNVNQRAGISAEAAEQQFGYQTQRDKQQTRAQMDRDTLQHGFQTSRDRAQFGFQTQRDETQQGYTQQNMTQRETFSVASKWQEQIQQARNAGMDFSEKQQQEMTLMEETFRKNVLNDPFLDEGLKQRAMLEHQRKLAGIVPNQKVKTGQQQLQESLQFDERVPGVPFLMGRDSQGNLTFQPLGGGGGGPKQVDPAKQAEEQRKNMLKREETLIKLDKEIRSEIDPDTATLKYKTQDEIDEEKLRRLAPYERFYTESGLPPHELYQLKAKRDELKAIEKQQRDGKTINMGDSLRLRSGDPAAQTAYEMGDSLRLRSGDPAARTAYEADPPQQMPGQTSSGPWPVASEMDATDPPQPMPGQTSPGQWPVASEMDAMEGRPMPPVAAPQNPVPVVSKTIDDQLKQSVTGGDIETATALKAVKDLTAKYKGNPPYGSEDRAILEDAMRFLAAKGYKFGSKKKQPKEADKFLDAIRTQGTWQQ